MKIVKKIAVLALIVLVILQFFGPEKNEGDIADLQPFLTETNPPASVQATLKVACYDCHSSNTRYPWYNNIEPVSYWMANHVKHGKDELNFSEWSTYSWKRKDHKLEEVIEEIEKGHMPIGSYLWTHSDAKLTETQVQEIADWVKNARAIMALGQQKPQ
ncbi:heme-binding domain-containing protein [Kordia sp. YSTF-M3]|uniref:Heme-binding domain-containing protein n=1 Tax=Kordia aestuariivivens TaxID=2759037 RepID=A0ABR7QE36_9FLAO|nr:heme-binding domain-containing protein [Kordia aestuariivivens]MBC8756824.1 heme-binding domain-containing protein [Kordia aestuariivivens]